MTYEIKKIITLTLTKEEQKTIQKLRMIFNEDEGLTLFDIWEVLSAIANNDSGLAQQYNYEIKIEN